MKRAVFLDRDGTINQDPGYLNNPDGVVLFPGVGQALRKLSEAGFLLIVVSNQSGIARGLVEPENLEKIHQNMNLLLKKEGAEIDDFFICSSLPEKKAPDRKPNPGLLLQGAEKYGIDLSESYMVGDRKSDLDAGKNAGCRAVALVRTGRGQETENKISPSDADFVGNDLLAVADWILETCPTS